MSTVPPTGKRRPLRCRLGWHQKRLRHGYWAEQTFLLVGVNLYCCGRCDWEMKGIGERDLAEPEAGYQSAIRELQGAIRECEMLREWIDAFGRESSSISVDDVLAASRKRVPPPTGGR